MNSLKLEPVDVKDLEIFSNQAELRKDLHLYYIYVDERGIKRTHRDNEIPKADVIRLVKMMSDPDALEETEEFGNSSWADFIDKLCFLLGLIDYDTKGKYIGYTSVEPSYPDNYIECMSNSYEDFINLPIIEQEWKILDALLNHFDCSNNEFFRGDVACSAFGRLDGFDTWGCATHVVPTLNFSKIRRFLLDTLSECESGAWFSTQSLVSYLKQHHRYFLIPQQYKTKTKYDKSGRYANFRERQGNDWSSRKVIPESDADSFERVEGRYIERFLEGIPLTMRYLDVAYEKDMSSKVRPSRNKLRAFRVNDRLKRVMDKTVPEPTLKVLPNFEIYIDCVLYPAGLISKLFPLTEMVSEDKTTILKLQKKKVAAHLAKNKNLDVIRLLREASGTEIPQNVATELEEWAGHSEKFTLYEGFSLLEGDKELPLENALIERKITENIRIIKNPGKVFDILEKAHLVPVRIKHPESSLRSLPDTIRTIFHVKTKTAKKPRKKREAIIKRQVHVTLKFPNKELLEVFCQRALNTRCEIEVNTADSVVRIANSDEHMIEQVLKEMKKRHLIRIEDI